MVVSSPKQISFNPSAKRPSEWWDMLPHRTDPWTDLVQGNWTMTNETLGAIWPVTYPDNQQGWTLSEYTDGRPGAGILSTNSMGGGDMTPPFPTPIENVQTRLVASSYATTTYSRNEFDRNVNLLDQESIDDALAHNPACINCHSSLDPSQATYTGFGIYSRTMPST